MFLVDLHCRIALSTLFYAFALGAWGALNFVLARGVNGNYFGALALGELLVIIQGALGVLLVVSGAWPADWLHFLYGVLSVVAWPAGYAYTQAGVTRREAGIYAILSFFVFAFGARAMMTGPGAAGPSCLPH